MILKNMNEIGGGVAHVYNSETSVIPTLNSPLPARIVERIQRGCDRESERGRTCLRYKAPEKYRNAITIARESTLLPACIRKRDIGTPNLAWLSAHYHMLSLQNVFTRKSKSHLFLNS